MKNTKQKILNAARKLFNTFGYSQVTIRMIATELGMSSGNLNYHFRKREDILEALYFEMVEVFDQRIQQLERQNFSLKSMKLDIQTSMQRMIDYRFFWTDLYFLLKDHPKIRFHFEQAKKDRIKGSHFVFDYFIQHQLLLPPSFPEEHALLIERMIDYSNTWLYASGLYKTRKDPAVLVEEASQHLLLMLFPYLSPEGRQQFRLLEPGLF
ncbi:MAG TPA: TetR family transcriptional regulator [Saprospiraceae bacterium]|nr:TetR family transcriptional regulator [Saprospiraceae bacterium]